MGDDDGGMDDHVSKFVEMAMSGDGTDVIQDFRDMADDSLADKEDEDGHESQRHAMVYNLLNEPMEDGDAALDDAFLILTPMEGEDGDDGEANFVIDVRMPNLSVEEYRELEEMAQEDGYDFNEALKEFMEIFLDHIAENPDGMGDVDWDDIMEARKDDAENGKANTEVSDVKGVEGDEDDSDDDSDTDDDSAMAPEEDDSDSDSDDTEDDMEMDDSEDGDSDSDDTDDYDASDSASGGSRRKLLITVITNPGVGITPGVTVCGKTGFGGAGTLGGAALGGLVGGPIGAVAGATAGATAGNLASPSVCV